MFSGCAFLLPFMFARVFFGSLDDLHFPFQFLVVETEVNLKIHYVVLGNHAVSAHAKLANLLELVHRSLAALGHSNHLLTVSESRQVRQNKYGRWSGRRVPCCRAASR